HGFLPARPASRGMDRFIQVVTAQPEEREAALRLVFRHFEAGEREKRVANGLQLLEMGKLNPEGLFVARDGERVAAARVCLPTQGAGALVWPPRTDRVASAAGIEDELIRRGVSWLQSRGAKLGQALMAPDEAHLAAPLARNGFRNVTTLCYMRRTVDQP